MFRNILAAALAAAGIAIGAWTFIAPDRPGPVSADGMSPQEFSRESPLLLPGILATIYEAFSQTEEAEIYDRLAKVATGPALEQLYLERVGAMAGGGLNPDQEIHEVSLLGMSARRNGNLVDITARWRVLGVVGHAEHMHMRGNAYAADLPQIPTDWATANDLFEKDPQVARIFDAELIRNLVLTKRQEHHYMQELSPQEQVEIYLDTV